VAILSVGVFVTLLLLGFAFMGPSEGKAQTRRLNSLKLRHSDSDEARVEAQMKKAVAARKPKARKIDENSSKKEVLANRLAMTGKNWNVQQYLYVCLGIMVVVGLLANFKGAPPLLALFAGLGVGIGLPHMVIGFLIKKRIANFTARFPDAIELLVRGLKSGLPVTETLAVVASEVPGPVGEEFMAVTQRIKIGQTMEDGLQESADRLNTPEFNFFVITLAIQRETGGNLAETLGNLADVLRKRSQMKLKVKAMASESKASAYIVGSLPFIVFGLIWFINPEYLGGFFYEERLIIAGLGGMTWMSIGVFIMSQMINFEI